MPRDDRSRSQLTHFSPLVLGLILPIAAVLALLLSGLQIYSEHRRDRAITTSTVQMVESRYVPELQHALSDADDAAVDRLLNTFSRHPQVVRIELQTHSGPNWQRAPVQQNDTPIRRSFRLRRASNEGPAVEIGVLSIDFVNRPFLERIWPNLATKAVPTFLVTFFAAALPLHVFARSVSHHLDSAAKTIRHQDWLHDPRDPEPPRSPLVQDELANLASALSDTRERMQSEVKEQAALSSDLVLRGHLLDHAKREQSQFTYAVSHDLKAPINTMSMLIQELEMSETVSEAGEIVLSDMRAVNKRMGQLVEDVRQYASMVGHEEEIVQTDLGEVVDRVLCSFDTQIKELNGRVTKGPLPSIAGRREQLTVLFRSIISNSLKFRHSERAPEITISSTRGDGSMQVVIEDNGIGVSEPFREEVFGMFKRLHAHAEFAGSGLGLAVSRRIMSNHGGWISITGAMDGGTVVTLTFSKA